MISMKRLAGGAALTVLALAASSAVYAQETTAAIRGEITSASGAPIAGANVTIVHTPSGTRSTVSSDASGVYDARGLRVGGPYVITVASGEFEPETIEGVNLTVGDTLRLNVDLESAVAVDAIIVTAARDVTSENTGTSSTLNRDDIQSVVTINRDIRDLARRNVLVSQNSRGDGGISIAGSNPRTNRIAIDGAQAQDDFGLNTGGLPTRRGPVSLDAIEQFTVNAVPIDVENGDFSGGALDVVLRSGANAFHGSAFVNYLNDGMTGRKIRGSKVDTRIKQENYGAFLSGPIIKDKLFFALSYEFYDSADSTSTGPTGAGFANSINGVSQATIDQVTSIFNTNYASKFEVGSIASTKPILDEKYTAKVDWNINENHRLSLTARYALSELTSRTDLSTSSAGLDSHWYLTGEEDYSYVGELNSQWTDKLSTTLRLTYRDYERRQNPPSGQEFSDIQICLAPTSVVATGNTMTSCGSTSTLRFGPDQFRHANFLETSNLQVQAVAKYALGDHLFKAGYQGQQIDIFNIFVPNSDGSYYFDSIADFAAGKANRLVYSNAVTGDANDAAADFRYTLHSVFAQDTLEITEKLRVTLGARYDWYKSDDKPAYNPNFVARNGFTNQQTYDGLSVLMPRGSVEYEPTEWLELRAGAGLFSGGLPDVFISNSFSNTGIVTAGIQIERTATGFTETTGAAGFTPAIGSAALDISLANAAFGYDIPASVQALQGGAVVPTASETNAILPSFKMPSDWKLFFTATLKAQDGWTSGFLPESMAPAFDNWRLSLDAVATEVNDGLTFRDFRAAPLVVNGVAQKTPDGRIRYDGIGGTAAQRAASGISSINAGSNRDIVALNADKGQSYTLGLSLSRSFDNGLDLQFGYARQKIEDQVSGARFASTASSLYGTGAAGLDPNEEAYGTAFEEIENRFKAEVGYRKKFFGDYESRFNLFAETRSGRPISFVMNDPASGRGSTFGVNRGNHLLYVPDFRADTNPNDLTVGFVTFANQATLDSFKNAVELFGLPQGRILEKGEGSDDNPEIYQVDFQYSQELPGFMKGHKSRLVFDVQNVLNLINDEWGVIEEYSDSTRLISAQCATSAGVAAPTGSPVCDRYLYSNFNTTAATKARDSGGRSVWSVQVGLRYEF
jgi:outer membrane receptor for ferrienterochelin and colicin